MDDILVNPTPIDIKKKNRELLYNWDELKGFITKDSLIVWYKDIQHIQMLKMLGMGTGTDGRYCIVIDFKQNVVYVDSHDEDDFSVHVEIIKNDKNLQRVITKFDVVTMDERDNE